MPTVPSRARASARVAALASLTLFAAACSDNGTGPGEQTLPIPEGTLAMLRCQASVVHATVACEPASDAPSAQGADGPSYALLGAQGVYVRLTTSGVTNGGGVFAFNMTVQNLSNKVMASTDGATRHADGARIFFHSGPTLTGGSGNLAVANATGTGTFTAGGQDYFQYGGSIGGTDQPELGADGILSTGEASSAKNWQITYDAGVTGFSFVLYVSAEIPAAGTLATAAPQVTGISPNPLVPGAAATLTGVNFNATPGNNTVTIGGQAATITGGNTTQLQVTVPCASSGSQPAAVTTGGMKGADFNHPLQVTQRTVAVGQALVLTSAADSYCNELTSAGGAARYAVAVFSASTSPTSNSPFQFSANPEGGEAPSAAVQPDAVHAPRLSLDAAMRLARVQGEDQRHAELLEKNAEMYQRLKARFGTGDTQLRPRRNVVAADPPLTRSFRISDLNATAPNNICNSYYVVSATRVYFDGKLAIYEDDATPNDFKASLNATMAANYLAIGDQFNDDMEPIIATNFGDVLRRDDVTDNNDVLVALSTPRLNTSFSGVAGFVVSCDQFPNDDASTPAVGGPYTGSVGSTNGASNFGEFFYMYQPVTTGAGYGGNTAQNWYRTIRSTFIHETKHVASMAARVANGAPAYEAAALEEGTARHSEELWMRNAVDNQAWKSNIPYGTAANPINVYCDVRPEGWPECLTNPRRPASIMQRHFTSLYTEMFGTNARLLSPFGPTASDNASYYYAVSWSLVRYAIDRYGASDAAFLTALTQSTTSGPTNLTTQAGVSIDQLLGGWALSLYADDFPGLGSPSTDIQMPSWDFRSVYAGLNSDFPATYTLAYPLVPQARSFGSFAPVGVATLRGGGVLWYEISGTQTAAQLLRLETDGGGPPSSNLRVAVTRLQ